MALTDKKYANEHPKFNMFDRYKADKDSLVGARADISGKDVDASKMRGYSSVDLDGLTISSLDFLYLLLSDTSNPFHQPTYQS